MLDLPVLPQPLRCEQVQPTAPAYRHLQSHQRKLPAPRPPVLLLPVRRLTELQLNVRLPTRLRQTAQLRTRLPLTVLSLPPVRLPLPLRLRPRKPLLTKLLLRRVLRERLHYLLSSRPLPLNWRPTRLLLHRLKLPKLPLNWLLRVQLLPKRKLPEPPLSWLQPKLRRPGLPRRRLWLLPRPPIKPLWTPWPSRPRTLPVLLPVVSK